MKKNPTPQQAFVGLLFVVISILISIKVTLALETALVMGTLAAALVAVYLGHNWEDIQDGMLRGIQNGLGACLILIAIGMVVGTWLLSGTIQTLIYFGLEWLTPSVFLPIGFLLCALTSLLIGSSFGTIATMGIVLMAISEGLGIPKEITAGMVISGAMFGDKISPISDSTNLTAAMSGTDLFKHVKSMLYVSIPAMVLCIGLYAIIGLGYHSSSQITSSVVNDLQKVLASNFNISLWTLIPPLLVLVLSYKKRPALPTLIASFIVSGVMAMVLQEATLASVLEVASSGYASNTGHPLVDKLLSQGGIHAMMSTIIMIILGTAMGGIMEKTGVLNVLLKALMVRIKQPKHLILSTLAASYMMLLATGEMMVSIIVPGRTLKPAYDAMGVDASVLSRTLETAATLGCGVLPWGVVSLYAQNILDVGFGYIPYAFLSFIAPVIVVLYAHWDKVDIQKDKGITSAVTN